MLVLEWRNPRTTQLQMHELVKRVAQNDCKHFRTPAYMVVTWFLRGPRRGKSLEELRAQTAAQFPNEGNDSRIRLKYQREQSIWPYQMEEILISRE
ncbi:hypothetical protein Ancab_021625 [Ancistrocladus abbreviatus]